MVRIRYEQTFTVVEFGKSYDSLDLAKLQNAGARLLREADRAEPPFLILDFSKTDFIGSNFIELLVRAWKRLKSRQGLLVLCSLKPFCEEVLRVSRLDQLWKVFPSREEAIEALAERRCTD